MNVTAVTSTREKMFRRSFRPLPSSAQLLRDALRQYFAAIDVAAADVAHLLLSADEAFINAVAHAPHGRVLVAAWVRDERLVLEVSDEGPGFHADPARRPQLPDLGAEHGRGLYLMHRLMDEVRIDSGDRGTVVRMELQLAPVASQFATLNR